VFLSRKMAEYVRSRRFPRAGSPRQSLQVAFRSALASFARNAGRRSTGTSTTLKEAQTLPLNLEKSFSIQTYGFRHDAMDSQPSQTSSVDTDTTIDTEPRLITYPNTCLAQAHSDLSWMRVCYTPLILISRVEVVSLSHIRRVRVLRPARHGRGGYRAASRHLPPRHVSKANNKDKKSFQLKNSARQ
jgi:hypothetical protein